MLYDVFDFIEVRLNSPCTSTGGFALCLRVQACRLIAYFVPGKCGTPTHACCMLPEVSACHLIAAQAAKARDGRVLLHCSQGVSRSASLAIAYLMWKQNSTFDSTLAAVKAIRGVANPNIGFTCQVCAPCQACKLQKLTLIVHGTTFSSGASSGVVT